MRSSLLGVSSTHPSPQESWQPIWDRSNNLTGMNKTSDGIISGLAPGTDVIFMACVERLVTVTRRVPVCLSANAY
ncbi:hypothetical protein Pyn_36830 [Prunus yedoensis var. nudiflora]|uniref:Uncharacterized protein n=1 Tax=Prunus yedoensis var. nudiflora TaxID=2094558 RepID=A0A315AYM7_PRUYE|nr:hypothetical protein Pyn_36830 [Prunus yedoensis var. nudiflora]